MRAQRFTDFGDLPLYLEWARALTLQVGALLLFLLLSGSSTLALEHMGAAAYTEQQLRSGWREVLRLALGPPRIGLQVGHEGVAEHPDELLHLRGNTGGNANGVAEVRVNRAVAAALAERLEAEGIVVDILPATPPAGYRADLLLALHADSVPDGGRTGYKSATFEPPRSPLEGRLKTTIDAAYLSATGLSDDSVNTTDNMRHYYAFNFRRYHHSIHPATPALIVELGYLSHPRDAALLRQPKRLAEALEGGVVRFLQARSRLP